MGHPDLLKLTQPPCADSDVPGPSQSMSPDELCRVSLKLLTQHTLTHHLELSLQRVGCRYRFALSTAYWCTLGLLRASTDCHRGDGSLADGQSDLVHPKEGRASCGEAW